MTALRTFAAAPQRVLTDLATTSTSVGLALVDRRSRALAEYWRSFAAVREPAELMALNLDYASQLMDDYTAACTETLKPVTAETAEPAAQPVQEAHAA